MADFVAGRGTEALGIIGTVLGGVAVAAQGVLGVGGVGAPRTATGSGSTADDPVSKESFDLALRLSKSERDVAILTAELSSEKKMTEVFNALNDKINRVVSDQTAINSAQAVTNCAVTSQLAVMQNNLTQIMGLTKLVVPNGSICPGWGDATVTVSTSTAAA